MTGACADCLRRTWLLSELAGHLEPVRSEIVEVLALEDEELLAAVGGRHRRRLAGRWLGVDPADLQGRAERAGLEMICRCDRGYPQRLRDLAGPPAVIHVAGGLDRFLAAADADPVAIVGSRRASAYGTGVARSLGRGLAAAGVPVISGLAMGIDSAAHEGALSGTAASDSAAHEGALSATMGIDSAAHEGALSATAASVPTIAVLPGSASQPYPRGARNLYRRLVQVGGAVSELPPGVSVRRWMFPARNRIIAALAAMTVIVEASPRSGALLTARLAQELGRRVGAVPGRITSVQAAGPHALMKDGARLIDSAQVVLDLLFEPGTRTAAADDRPELAEELSALLRAIEDGHDTAGALRRHGLLPDQTLAPLAALELAGYVQRGAGGRFTRLP